MADMPLTDTLDARQVKALEALLSEPSVAKAAEASAVPLRTLYNWLREPAFADAYREARRESVQQAIARLQQASSVAVTVLLQLMATKNTPAAVRLAAASRVLEMSVKGIELDDVVARLEALEAAHAQKP